MKIPQIVVTKKSSWQNKISSAHCKGSPFIRRTLYSVIHGFLFNSWVFVKEF